MVRHGLVALSVLVIVVASASAAQAGGGRARTAARSIQKPTQTDRVHGRTKPRGLGRVFARLARKKGDRVFHAEGQAFHGSIRSPDGTVKPVIVRLSRGGAGKSGKPDILGVAVKVQEPGGGSQDFLLVTARGSRGIKARLPARRGSFAGQSVSSLTSFRSGSVRGPVTAEMPDSLLTSLDVASRGQSSGQQTFELQLNNSAVSRLTRGGPRQQSLGQVTIDLSRPLSARQNAELEMTPFNTAGGVEPVGLVNRLRRSAYHGSQTGRAAE